MDGRTVAGTPGTFVQIPRGTPHAFRNNTAPPIPPTPGEIEKLIAAAPRYGIVLLPPPQH